MSNGLTDLPTDTDIQSPADFEILLVLLSRLLDAGLLKQRAPEGASTDSIDLRKLRPDGPWPDIVEAEFVGTDGRRYQLFVDTFHGAGGHWRAMD